MFLVDAVGAKEIAVRRNGVSAGLWGGAGGAGVNRYASPSASSTTEPRFSIVA